MKADPRSKISKGNRRYRPSAKPPLRRFSPYRYEFSLLYPASNEMRHARSFSRLRDAADVPHAIAASVYECEAIVAYDDHFSATSDLIPYKTPEDYL